MFSNDMTDYVEFILGIFDYIVGLVPPFCARGSRSLRSAKCDEGLTGEERKGIDEYISTNYNDIEDFCGERYSRQFLGHHSLS